jgi:hypothetical protein
MAYFRQSKRRTALFLEALLKQPCCPGLALKMQGQVTQALRPAYEELAGALPSQQHLGIDELPTKEAAAKAWLWTFGAGLFTVFAVRRTRAASATHRRIGQSIMQSTECSTTKYQNLMSPADANLLRLATPGGAL